MQFPKNVTKLCGGRCFSFRCHPDVLCFTECCRELDLALTPYDVLRLRKELQMNSTEFIERYVVVEQETDEVFPRLYLGMVDDGRASCPFISQEGCTVYKGRPGACRAYPVGRGVSLDASGKVCEIHVLVREEHCQGFAEPDSHNVSEWFEKQGLFEYNALNDEVLSLLEKVQGRKDRRFTLEQQEDFMLALYKLDGFRKQLESSAFQEKFMLSAEERNSALADDLSLLRFGISWLKEALFSEKNE